MFTRDTNARVAYFEEHTGMFVARRERQCATLRHRVNGVGCEHNQGLLQLAFVAGNDLQIVGRARFNLYVLAAPLMREQAHGGLHHVREINADMLACACG
jgi:hypothetical protein